MPARMTELRPQQAQPSRARKPTAAVQQPEERRRVALGPEGGVAAWFRAGLVQAKLILGRPGDRYEAEADRLADRVLRLPTPVVQPKPG